jgi:hypothetical protein
MILRRLCRAARYWGLLRELSRLARGEQSSVPLIVGDTHTSGC